MGEIIAIERTSPRLRDCLLLSLFVISLGCHQGPPQYRVAPASNEPYPSGDAAAVYRAVLDKLYLSSPDSPPFIVLWDSAHIRMNECWQQPCQRIPPHKSNISHEVVRAFERATLLTAPLNPNFGFQLPIRLLSESDRSALVAVGQPLSDSLLKVNRYSESMPFWLGFRKRFPGAWGYAVLTRVGLDRQRQHALVQVMHRCGSSCGHEEDMFLEKIGGRWTVAERMLIGLRGSDWLDVVQRFNSPIGDGRDSLVLGPFRYLGPDARYLALYHVRTDSIRAWIRDSVARDQLPRRIRGTIRSRLTQQPLPFAEIIAHAAPNDMKIRIVSDSTGRYAFNDLPIGGTMLEVQCPGSHGAAGKTLDAPGLYAHAAIDTVIDFAVPDIAPCWHSLSIHPLQSGWFESKEAGVASSPSVQERKVYAAVIDALRTTKRSVSPVAIFSHTVPRCEYNEGCGTVQFARLERAGSVDSFMIRQFTANTANPIALDPAFARSLRLHVVTAQEIAYYAEDPIQFGYRHLDPGIDSVRFWAAFKKLNGAAKGIVSLGGVAFDESHTRALVEARLDTALERAPATMMLLQKMRSHWRVLISDVARTATSGESMGKRCLPVKAPSPPKKEAVVRLSGDFALVMVPASGSRGTSSAWLRLSPASQASIGRSRQRFYAKSPYTKAPPVFEIIDETTEQPDESRSQVLWINGAGLEIRRKLGRSFGSEYSESLRILRVTSSGFFGNWAAGVYGPSEFGYFCALRR